MEVAVLNKVLVGLGMVAVLGLMGAGVAYAVTGSENDGRTGEGGNGGRWQTSEASGTGARWSAEATGADGTAGQGSGGRWQTLEADGAGGRWSGEGSEVNGSQAASEEFESVSGVVQSLDGSLLVLQTEAGEAVEVSLGQPGYWEAQGLSLVVGDEVVIDGYYEDDATLAAGSVTFVATGQTVVLRDKSGRPMWAGGRRNGGAGTAPAL
jgi:hypothetical protein